jgi:hypothetical protein
MREECNMTDEEDRKKREKERKEKERKRTIERERVYQHQRLVERHKYRNLHDKHKDRRKRDCMIGLPFIIAFQGDPTMTYYCADLPTSFELIPRTERYPSNKSPFERLATYLDHHVVSLHVKILIYKAS